MVDTELRRTGPIAKGARSDDLVHTIVLDHRHLDTIDNSESLTCYGRPRIRGCRSYSVICVCGGEAETDCWNEEEEHEGNKAILQVGSVELQRRTDQNGSDTCSTLT